MLSARELAKLRLDLDAELPSTCNILSLTRGTTSTGGGSITWSTAVANVACDGWPGGGSETSLEDRLDEGSNWTFVLPQGTAIDRTNRIEFGSSTYDIMDVEEGFPNELDLYVRANRTGDGQ